MDQTQINATIAQQIDTFRNALNGSFNLSEDDKEIISLYYSTKSGRPEKWFKRMLDLINTTRNDTLEAYREMLKEPHGPIRDKLRRNVRYIFDLHLKRIENVRRIIALRESSIWDDVDEIITLFDSF